jgi:hypothetical protein
MNQLHSGELAHVSTEAIRNIRGQITSALEEVIEVGARIRPLTIRGERVGWLRGLYYSERKILLRWYPNVGERTKHILLTATTLNEKEILDLDGFEFRSLLRKVVEAEAADTTLFPFLSPFVTTSSSESLWYGLGGSEARRYKEVDLLDGHVMKFLAVPDHCRLWLLLCNYREQSKQKLAGAQDAALVAKSFIGKGAARMLNDLNKAAKALMVDIDDPWKMTIRVVADDVDLQDGWGHAHLDISEEGLLREGEGMLAEDKHEQFMARFYAQQEDRQRHEAETQLQNLQRAYDVGVEEKEPRVMTESEVRGRRSSFENVVALGQQMAHDEMAAIDGANSRSRYGDEDLVPIMG